MGECLYMGVRVEREKCRGERTDGAVGQTVRQCLGKCGLLQKVSCRASLNKRFSVRVSGSSCPPTEAPRQGAAS